MEFPSIHLYNTLTRTKEKFKPINDNEVLFYSCGQTVYEEVHVGNAKTYLVWDLLTRVLRYFGYNVKHIQNFTDVGHLTDDADEGEDKIVKRAKLLNEHPMELVDRKINEYHADMDRLNVSRPNLAPRATAHITEMIDLVLKLMENGHAYESDGSIYFDISTFPNYHKLAKLDLDNLVAGARVEVIEGKKNPGDFALWIKAPIDHIMQYSSPWGRGYPGWHLECSTMAIKYLGETIDIHAGGIDHIPVHHTNEIAQSEGSTGKKFANFWMHSEFITLNGEKMSKSTGNYISLKDLLTHIGGGVARFSLLHAHYKTQGDFSMNQAKSMRKRYNRIMRSHQLSVQEILRYNEEIVKSEIDDSLKFLQKFNNALADDLNTPQAFAQVNTIAKRMDQIRKNRDLPQLINFVNTYELMMDVLGIPLINLAKDEIVEVDNVLKTRQRLRQNEQIEDSDAIRKLLTSKNYVIQDLDEKTEWYRHD